MSRRQLELIRFVVLLAMLFVTVLFLGSTGAMFRYLQ